MNNDKDPISIDADPTSLGKDFSRVQFLKAAPMNLSAKPGCGTTETIQAIQKNMKPYLKHLLLGESRPFLRQIKNTYLRKICF